MSSSILIKNARIVNEGQIISGDVYIENGRIEKIDSSISQQKPETKIIEAEGKFLLPGIIDDQVHFREPGLTHKGDIQSESLAALAGGTTSYIEQPNTVPQATTLEELEKKYDRAAKVSHANYGFNLGATNDNLEELKKADKSRIPGIKIFMGSSTGNMLVDDLNALEKIFSQVDNQLITHCEDEATIRANYEAALEKYGENIPFDQHPIIRSEEACYLSSSSAVELAKKHGSRLHVFHISTGKETHLFEKGPLGEKKITSEACIHHLWFDDSFYAEKGAFIKWNPAVKTAADREEIWEAVRDGRIDVIATDHAPHTLEEKNNTYPTAPSGGPLVQHGLPAMMEAVRKGRMDMEMLVQKMCHNPALLFGIVDRGFIREGYYADLVLVDPSSPWTVTKDNILYKCKWSPFEGNTFASRVTHTILNGEVVYENGKLSPVKSAMRLAYNR